MTQIEKHIIKLLPDEKKRNLYLDIFKEIILYANSFGTEKWGVHCKPRIIRLLIGNLIVASIHKNCLWLPLDSESLESMAPDQLKELENDWDTGEWATYDSINSKNIYYSDDDLEKWKIIKPLHFKSIENASQKYTTLKEASRKNISYELIDYLNQLFKSSIPKPKKIKKTEEKSGINKKDLKKIFELEEKIKNLTPKSRLRISKQIERGTIANLVKKLNNFECQICKQLGLHSLSFKKPNDEYYIETHHVIEVALQRKGSLGLSNLITLCPNHHRQIHYGKTELLEINNSSFVFQIDENRIEVDRIKIS